MNQFMKTILLYEMKLNSVLLNEMNYESNSQVCFVDLGVLRLLVRFILRVVVVAPTVSCCI
jgi:hypothetical protein